MGGNVADYVVVKDTSFRLPVDNNDPDITLPPFSLPGDTIVSQPSILSFNVAGDAALNVTINNKVVVDRMRLGSAGAGVLRCIQEAFEPNVLKAGGGNQITFAVESGSCSLSDVVIWFQNAT
jgi:hypothetical protein